MLRQSCDADSTCKAPIQQSFERTEQDDEHGPAAHHPARPDLGDETFMTTDTSFVDNPPSSRAPTKFAMPAPMARPSSGFIKRGGEAPTRGGRGGASAGRARGNRGSGIARGKPRGAR